MDAVGFSMISVSPMSTSSFAVKYRPFLSEYWAFIALEAFENSLCGPLRSFGTLSGCFSLFTVPFSIFVRELKNSERWNWDESIRGRIRAFWICWHLMRDSSIPLRHLKIEFGIELRQRSCFIFMIEGKVPVAHKLDKM